jgi:hypothetical protein
LHAQFASEEPQAKTEIREATQLLCLMRSALCHFHSRGRTHRDGDGTVLMMHANAFEVQQFAVASEVDVMQEEQQLAQSRRETIFVKDTAQAGD